MAQDDPGLQLLFTPGFSTAEKVTETSGRGVGMDGVRSNILLLLDVAAIGQLGRDVAKVGGAR